MNTRDCLNMLNLDSASTDQDLKLAYRKAVKQWHPDRYQQSAEETRATAEQQMQALNTAYTTLSKYYDMHGYMPGYIAPENDRSAADHAATDYEADSQVFKQSKRESDWVPPTQTAGRSHSKQPENNTRRAFWQQGKLWFAVVAVVMVASYIYSDSATNSSESPAIVADGKTSDLPVSAPQTEQTKPVQGKDAVEVEESNSPFASKERKSAFEQTSPLGIYEESADEKYFTYGDTAGRVFEIQGVPTKTVGDIWYYGMSEVHFQDGRVKSWFVSEGNRLKARKH